MKAKVLRERDIERYLVKRVEELGGEVRKVSWIGRRYAPDRVVFFHSRGYANTAWVELKNPETIVTFPANAHERAQFREQERMRRMGQRVEVVGTIEQVNRLLR